MCFEIDKFGANPIYGGSIALFSSEEKGKVFIPEAEEKNCVLVASKTGKLIDIDVEAVKKALPVFDLALALA